MEWTHLTILCNQTSPNTTWCCASTIIQTFAIPPHDHLYQLQWSARAMPSIKVLYTYETRARRQISVTKLMVTKGMLVQLFLTIFYKNLSMGRI
jgi:hypothetical protein